MSNFVFGDCEEIVCNHLGNTYRYYPKGNETFNVDKGGIRGNDDANQVTSAGDMMSQLNRARWSVDGPIAIDQISDIELSTLNLMAGSPSLGLWTFSMISGAIYRGTGRPVGDLATDANAGTLSLKVAGGGNLQKY